MYSWGEYGKAVEEGLGPLLGGRVEENDGKNDGAEAKSPRGGDESCSFESTGTERDSQSIHYCMSTPTEGGMAQLLNPTDVLTVAASRLTLQCCDQGFVEDEVRTDGEQHPSWANRQHSFIYARLVRNYALTAADPRRDGHHRLAHLRVQQLPVLL